MEVSDSSEEMAGKPSADDAGPQHRGSGWTSPSYWPSTSPIEPS